MIQIDLYRLLSFLFRRYMRSSVVSTATKNYEYTCSNILDAALQTPIWKI